MGTPAPNITGTTTGTVQEATGVVMTGALTDNGNNATPNTWSIVSGATYGTATIDPSTGLWSYDLDDTNAIVQALDPGQTLTDVFTVRLSDRAGADSQVITITIQGNFCFAADTLLRSTKGMVPAHSLQCGDAVWTLDHGFQPLRWVGRQSHSAYDLQRDPSLRAVLIRKGALGGSLPARDMQISRQHRILLRAGFLQRMIGAPEALVPAHRLIGLPGVTVAPIGNGIDYVHFLFDRHEIVMAEGIGAESLYMGREVVQGQNGGAREDEFAAIPADLRSTCAQTPARPIPDTAAQKRIAGKLLAIVADRDLGGRFGGARLPQGADWPKTARRSSQR